MTISGKALALVDWWIGIFPLLVVFGIGPLEETYKLGLLVLFTWTALFTWLGIRAWRSSNYPRRY